MKRTLKKLLLKASERLYRFAVNLGDDGDAENSDLLRYPECMFSNSRAQTLKDLSDRLEDYIESRKLYMDPDISLSRIAAMVGSNRTYVSNILSSKKGFKTYLNELRFKSICQQIEALQSGHEGLLGEDEERVDASRYANIILRNGFSDMRTFRRQLSIVGGEWASRLRNMVY